MANILSMQVETSVGNSIYLVTHVGFPKPYTVKAFDPYGRQYAREIHEDPVEAIEAFIDLSIAPAGKRAEIHWDNTGE